MNDSAGVEDGVEDGVEASIHDVGWGWTRGTNDTAVEWASCTNQHYWTGLKNIESRCGWLFPCLSNLLSPRHYLI